MEPKPSHAMSTNMTWIQVKFADEALASQPPPHHPNQQSSPTQPKKRTRVLRACDSCNKRGIKCSPWYANGGCNNCVGFRIPCTYNRTSNMKAFTLKETEFTTEVGGSQAKTQVGEMGGRMFLDTTRNATSTTNAPWFIPGRIVSMIMNGGEEIQHLVEVYFEVVYPIFPWFHEPSMNQRIADQHYLTDHSFFANTMAMCALASVHAKGGAMSPGWWDLERVQTLSAEFFFAAAKDALPQELGAMRGLDWLRTCALLSLYGNQVGKMDIMHQYLGMHHSLVSMDRLHDEKNWPKNMGIVETELRRRLFWSMYTLEVCSAVVWGSIIRYRESQCCVSFPSEVDDDHFSDAGYHPAIRPSTPYVARIQHQDPTCWLHGWNFTTNVYRLLEHAIEDFLRHRPTRTVLYSPSGMFQHETPPRTEILDEILVMSNELPPRFQLPVLASLHSQGSQEYRFECQAANISSTLQLARFILATCEIANTEQKCSLAFELLESFEKVPVYFVRAISFPLLQHVAAIGNILASETEGLVSDSAYESLRGVMLGMEIFLSRHEGGTIGLFTATTRLSKKILDIERSMASQRRNGLATIGVTWPSPNFPPSNIEQETNLNIDPELESLMMGTFTSEMPSSSLTATTNPFNNWHEANDSGNGHENEQMQSQLPQDLAKTTGDMSRGHFGNGLGGGFGSGYGSGFGTF